jgi:hypothetical protein
MCTVIGSPARSRRFGSEAPGLLAVPGAGCFAEEPASHGAVVQGRCMPPSDHPPSPDGVSRGQQPDRENTGWIVLPGDHPFVHRPFAHRPDPGDSALFMCRLPREPGHELLDSKPQDVNACGRCSVEIGRARRKVRRAAERAAARLIPPRFPAAEDPEAADRLDRTRQRGSSVRTVGGGLPGLGNRR